ncbi:MAG: TVP38/TMEM64 family protein [Sedimentisphaerales bacterium]
MSLEKTEQNKGTLQKENIEAVPRQWWRPILLFSVIAVVLVLAKVLGLMGRLLELQDWIKGQGVLGYVLFALIHIGAMIAAVPRAVLAVTAGVLFGAVAGIILVTICSVIGVCLTFLIARYFARDVVSRWLLRSEKLNRFYHLTEKRGAIIVVITRLLTFSPSNLLNYCFGLTKIHISTYLFWSFLCMLPATVVYVLAADAVTKGMSQVQIPWLSVSTVVMVLIIVFMVVHFSLLKLRKKEGIIG